MPFLKYILDPQGGLRLLKEMGQPPFVPCRVPTSDMMSKLPGEIEDLVKDVLRLIRLSLYTAGSAAPISFILPPGLYPGPDRFQGGGLRSLEWLAAMCSHAPNKAEQMLSYYGLL